MPVQLAKGHAHSGQVAFLWLTATGTPRDAKASLVSVRAVFDRNADASFRAIFVNLDNLFSLEAIAAQGRQLAEIGCIDQRRIVRKVKITPWGEVTRRLPLTIDVRALHVPQMPNAMRWVVPTFDPNAVLFGQGRIF